MFKKLKMFLSLLKEMGNLNNNLKIMRMQILYDIEYYIKKQDKKRKEKMSVNELAKEALLIDGDYLIISTQELKEYITKKVE